MAMAERPTTPFPEVGRILARAAGSDPAGLLYRAILPRTGGLLADPERYRFLWKEPWARVESDIALLDSGEATIEEEDGADLAILRAPRPLHPMAVYPRTHRMRVLTVIPDGTLVLAHRYETWVEYVSRELSPRIDLTPLAERPPAPRDAPGTLAVRGRAGDHAAPLPGGRRRQRPRPGALVDPRRAPGGRPGRVPGARMSGLAWVDVFAAEPMTGNPLAVVLDADDWPVARMQAFAAELGISETTFVLAPEGDGDQRVRIFTPVMELPMAGHPIVGTAWVLRAAGRIGERARLETGAGVLAVRVQGMVATMDQAPPRAGALVDAAEAAAAAGVEPGPGPPAQVWSTGMPQLMLRGRPRLARGRPARSRRPAPAGRARRLARGERLRPHRGRRRPGAGARAPLRAARRRPGGPGHRVGGGRPRRLPGRARRLGRRRPGAARRPGGRRAAVAARSRCG